MLFTLFSVVSNRILDASGYRRLSWPFNSLFIWSRCDKIPNTRLALSRAMYLYFGEIKKKKITIKIREKINEGGGGSTYSFVNRQVSNTDTLLLWQSNITILPFFLSSKTPRMSHPWSHIFLHFLFSYPAGRYCYRSTMVVARNTLIFHFFFNKHRRYKCVTPLFTSLSRFGC